ncbi:UDP-N-acetyl-D-mannosamine dehydrogenase protein [Marine Group I thaumarchaeote SCGC RSA3]|uniref:UDP-N-acetyl-D-mannosamine dehydrogenase n=2 Tax=Marine Group I TaxID=905826 RepID=A0A087RM41_9ARCH|nr:UDP-N-acetyl-D-mannosamine dehydrogenase protein [Marine Group I thaumarchaeote SCGC AAA799-D11]KFM19939.1 UDP-N-acetyl-D-mannosamine dehydrogenase protein [Marine Group I thaumarchaeote SCGC RSA3]
MKKQSIFSDIKAGKKIISVYGLGNVGGPIAAAWLRKGAKIIGVDISQNLLDEIQKGKSHKVEPNISDTFSKGLKLNKLSLTSDGIEASKESHIKFVAVPVGLNKNKIDLNSLLSATKSIAKGLKKNDVVIICPSLPPGTTANLVKDVLEKNSKLKVERDFYLIYSPERIFEGRALQDIEENYPAIISGYGKNSLDFADSLLQIISKKGTIRMSSMANAEAEKLFEGVYRDVNIALANELADYCEKVGVNFWEARKGANSQPFCHLHYPGTGVGGLCIPVYPRFILESGNNIGKSLKIIQNSRKINDAMPIKCVKDSLDLLKKSKINPKNAKITILGLGFRGDVTDSRLSPTYDVVNEFLKIGSKVIIHDPFISEDSKIPKNVILTSNLSKAVKNSSLIFISSDHKMYSKLTKSSFSKVKKPLLIFDGRNILNKKSFSSESLLTIGLRD